MKLKAKLGGTLSSSLKLNEKSLNTFENHEGFLRPRLKKLVDSLQDNILRDIPVSPVVAGGFIRDILVEAKPKDVDVFIQFDPQLDEFDRDHFKNLIEERLTEDGAGEIDQPFFGLRDMSENYQHTESEGQVLDGVLEFACAGFLLDNLGEMWYPPSIQLIAHRQEPAELLDRFDLNICKVAYLPKEDTFIYTPEFMDDFTNKKVTLDDRYKDNLASLRRYDRIERKMRRAWEPKKNTKTASSYTPVSTSLFTNHTFHQAAIPIEIEEAEREAINRLVADRQMWERAADMQEVLNRERALNRRWPQAEEGLRIIDDF